MKRERRQPTRTEWEQITSRRPVVRRVERRPIDRPENGTAEESRVKATAKLKNDEGRKR